MRGDSDPSSRELTPAAEQALQLVNEAIENTQVYHIDSSLSSILIICPTKPLPTGIIWQKPGPIEWLHLYNSASKVLDPYYELVSLLTDKGRTWMRQLLGRDPNIIIPYNQKQQAWLNQYSDSWSLSVAQYNATIDCHYLPDKLIQFLIQTPVIFPKVVFQVPISKAITVFMDGSNNGVAAIHTPTRTYSKQTNVTSSQRTELLVLV